MVPREFVVHQNLPLTPQGKLNRAALIHFQTSKTVASTIKPKNDLERALAALWHSLLPGECSPNDTFAALGGDSMLAIKLMLGVEEIIGQSLEISAFLVKPTFAGLCEAVKARLAGRQFQPILALRKQGTRPPLICLYGHGGDIGAYFQMTEALGNDQPVYGIRSPALEDMARLPQSIEQAAAEVIPWIRKIQPEGAPALVGYSWAGLLVFEVARQLREKEGVQCFTALIGSSAPVPIKNISYRLQHFTRNFPNWFRDLLTDQEGRGRRLTRWREMALTTKDSLSVSVLPEHEDEALTAVSNHLLNLGLKYHPPYQCEMELELIREREDFIPRAHPLHTWNVDYLPDCGWGRWVRKKPRIHWLESNHVSIIRPPAVNDLARVIRETMDEYLKKNGK
jgi:thioesterase domain-containing protein